MSYKNSESFFEIFLITSSIFIDKLFKLISTNTGLNPFNNTELISEIHVRLGTIISFLYLFLFKTFKIPNVIKFADEPEFT